jgi:hypothetical protein
LQLAAGLFIGYALGSFKTIPLCFIVILHKLGPCTPWLCSRMNSFCLTYTISMCIFVATYVFSIPSCIDYEAQINNPNKNPDKGMIFSRIRDFKIGMLAIPTFTIENKNIQFMEVRAPIIATRLLSLTNLCSTCNLTIYF